ncbi:MAG: hypothetical protein HN521_25260 [Candidatus Latescibacteria bacterium]|jgi:hypothetical protein|nr:hypothetical protein [Candidatus Latescibacterota bacterium]MBT5828584.1 hypothetical protein [Candidatus Latescibacterota bacterium]
MARVRWPVFLIGLLALWGCGGERDPVVEMQRSLASAPDYMIVLDDMREEGAFFTKYYHKYLITQGERQAQSDWVEVSESVFQKYEPFLGMALVSKTDQGVNNTAHPPGYDRVGNPQYGQWTNRGGSSFWEFYGQYAFMSSMLGWNRGYGMSRLDYDDYRTSRRNQRPYYGKNREYGSQGTVTQKQKPSAFARRKQAVARKKSSFSQKIKSRASQGRSSFGSSSRSRSGFGGRSGGGFGK